MREVTGEKEEDNLTTADKLREQEDDREEHREEAQGRWTA